MKKKRVIQVVIGLLFIGIAGVVINNLVGTPTPLELTNTPVTVTAVIPLTGPLADIGTTEKLGITLALEDAKKHGPALLRFNYEDSSGKGPTAVSVVQKRLSIDKDRFFIVTTTTPVLATLPVFRDLKNDKLVLAQTMYPNAVAGYPFAFTIYASSRQEARMLAEHAARNGLKKIASLNIENAWGTQSAATFKEVLEAEGGSITLAESFTFADRDFRLLLTKALKDKPDAILVYAYPTTFPVLLRQLAELDEQIVVLANANMADPAVMTDIPASILSRTVFPAPKYVFPTDNPDIVQFNERVAATGRTPTFDIAAFYDMTMILHKAVAGAKSSAPTAVRESLTSLFPYEGVTGRMVLTQNRDLEVDYVLARWVEGRLDPVE